jgi:hypothetical protein
MKVSTLLVCLVIVGCGSSSGSTSTVNNVTMQGGQWEYVVTPDNGSIAILLEANLPGANIGFTAPNAVIFQPSQISLNFHPYPIWCTGYAIEESISGSNLNGKVSVGAPPAQFADFSGNLAANGQAISSGKYSGEFCSDTNAQIKGTLTGYTIAPMNGTYRGTLTSSDGPDVVTFTLAQNPDFSLNVSGTSVVNGVSTVLVGGTDILDNSVTGAMVFSQGTAENVNGSNLFSFAGHLNPTATQLTVAAMNVANTELTGALTKQ